MGHNLPPGALNHPQAPWNREYPEDHLPAWCDKCRFKAETVAEMEGHEHENHHFDDSPQEISDDQKERWDEYDEWEREQMTSREKRAEEDFAEQDEHYKER